MSSCSATARRIAAMTSSVTALSECPLDLLDDREPLLSLDLDREGRGAASTERRVAPLRRPLDVLRIDVPARGG